MTCSSQHCVQQRKQTLAVHTVQRVLTLLALRGSGAAVPLVVLRHFERTALPPKKKALKCFETSHLKTPASVTNRTEDTDTMLLSNEVPVLLGCQR